MPASNRAAYKGEVIFPDLEELQNLKGQDIRLSGSMPMPIELVELPVPNPPQKVTDPYRRIKADLPNHSGGRGGTFDLWLYGDHQVKGKWTYLADAETMLPPRVIDAHFAEEGNKLIIRGNVLEQQIIKYGVYIEVEKSAHP